MNETQYRAHLIFRRGIGQMVYILRDRLHLLDLDDRARAWADAIEGGRVTESPIELVLYAAMLGDPSFDSWTPEHQWKPKRFYIEPQKKLGSYRADFLISGVAEDGIKRLVVECDGHDFHERTKEQAQRDKSRDRDLMAAGYTAMRFTGSEIYRAPEAAIIEISMYLGNAMGWSGAIE